MSLSEPLLVYIQHFVKLFFILPNWPLIWLDIHSWSKCQLKHQSRRRWVEALPFSFQLLFYGGLCQWICSIQSLVSFISKFLTNVTTNCSRIWIRGVSKLKKKNGNEKLKTKNSDLYVIVLIEEGNAIVLKCRYLAKGLIHQIKGLFQRDKRDREIERNWHAD